MQISNEKRNQYANKLIVLCSIYIAFKLLNMLDWNSLIYNIFWDDYELYIFLMNIRSSVFQVFFKAINLLILIAFIKFRQTEETSRLYNILLKINIVLFIITIVLMLLSVIINMFFQDFLLALSFDQMSTALISLISVVYYVVEFAIILLPVPVYILILKKEKLDYNWMIIGLLTNLFFYFVSYGTTYFREFLIRKNVVFTVIEFNEKFPFLGMNSSSAWVIFIEANLWIAGIIALIVLFKKKYKKSEDLQEG